MLQKGDSRVGGDVRQPAGESEDYLIQLSDNFPCTQRHQAQHFLSLSKTGVIRRSAGGQEPGAATPSFTSRASVYDVRERGQTGRADTVAAP